MFITVDNTHYFVNTHKYQGTPEAIAEQVVQEVMSRMSIPSTRVDREKIRRKVYNRYLEAAKAA